MNLKIKSYFETTTDASTLAFFRLAFGFMMFLGLIRFAANGWIDKFYIQPAFHFTYYGFSWVTPLGIYTYGLYFICAIAALFVAIGFKYRMSAILFFLTFTYAELMDKTTYLNHYYFVSVVAFVLIFLPANAYFSVDAYKNPKHAFQKIPRYSVDILKLLLAIVYLYAGIAKLNSDWLFEAMPLKIWLPGNVDLPIIGSFLNDNWLHYAFSWIGAFYDLVIVFLLLSKRTRLFAFFLVVIFHLLTRILFPIGIFPYIMIISTLIFFSSDFHQKALSMVAHILQISMQSFNNAKVKVEKFDAVSKLKLSVLTTFVIIQLLFPFRYAFYQDELFWTEEGYRFSWRVMLMEKAGYTQFVVTDSKTNQKFFVDNSDYLTVFQEKQMSFQPDFILEYAHYLRDIFEKKGVYNPQVHAESYVALNGRLSKLYINPEVDLAKENESFNHKTWLMPLDDEIKGF